MPSDSNLQHLVAVIGAGPSGIFAARELAAAGVHTVLFNRDIKPGGLAEYGIYPDKHKMKEGLRNQFRQTLALENIDYYGNIHIAQDGDLSLDDLRALGFQALLVTVGAQGTKWLGLPGEDLRGVYHAKDIVYNYNRLPPYSTQSLEIGRRVVVIGVGNVMMDIAHHLIYDLRVDEVIAIARRGPNEIKFDRGELEYVIGNLDIASFDQEISKISELIHSLAQDPDRARSFVQSTLEKARPSGSNTRLSMRFLLSPYRILGDANGRASGLEVEHNTLVLKNDEVRAQGLGTYETLDVDTVIFAIGDRVDEHLGLPVAFNEYVKSLNPRYPIEGNSYEIQDPATASSMLDVFVAGWARRASEGLVGIARRDGSNGAKAVLKYLQTTPVMETLPLEKLRARLALLPHAVVDKSAVAALEAAERERAVELGLEEYKFATCEEMLRAIQTNQPITSD